MNAAPRRSGSRLIKRIMFAKPTTGWENAYTSHKIEARDLYNLVLADIIEHDKMVLQNAEAFYGWLTDRLEQRYSIDESS